MPSPGEPANFKIKITVAVVLAAHSLAAIVLRVFAPPRRSERKAGKSLMTGRRFVSAGPS